MIIGSKITLRRKSLIFHQFCDGLYYLFSFRLIHIIQYRIISIQYRFGLFIRQIPINIHQTLDRIFSFRCLKNVIEQLVWRCILQMVRRNRTFENRCLNIVEIVEEFPPVIDVFQDLRKIRNFYVFWRNCCL